MKQIFARLMEIFQSGATEYEKIMHTTPKIQKLAVLDKATATANGTFLRSESRAIAILICLLNYYHGAMS